jgi:translation initiation factor 1
MARQNFQRIPTEGTVSAPLATPFAGLDLGALPEGPETPVKAETSTPNLSAQGKGKKSQGRVVLWRETAGRNGKGVTVLRELPTHWLPHEIEQLARNLRKSLGCGGTIRGRDIEVQCEDAARVRRYLEEQGFRVGGVGG